MYIAQVYFALNFNFDLHKILGNLYQVHLSDTVCDNGLLWSGKVEKQNSFNERIEECERKCDQNVNCKFMALNIANDWCQTYSSCDIVRVPNHASITFTKKGKFLKRNCKINLYIYVK